VTTTVTDVRGGDSKTTTITTLTDVKAVNDNSTTITGVGVKVAQSVVAPATITFRTLSDSCKPIIVVNGKVATTVALSGLTPDSIKSIMVLKGESAIKLYGSAAVNGVVQVTTK
jgi:TonB-dependent SusC/RagA subfamily outer membrane receptor